MEFARSTTVWNANTLIKCHRHKYIDLTMSLLGCSTPSINILVTVLLKGQGDP